MLNSITTSHPNNRSFQSCSHDAFQTRTGDETSLLRQPASVPASCAPHAPELAANSCADCGVAGQMISAEKAAVICQCSRRLIYRWIEEGSLHFRELPDGTVLVCGATLTAKLEQLEDATGHLAR